MSCSNCTQTKLIPTCTGILQVGLVAPDTDYWVHVKNLITGNTYRQTNTSDVAGLLTFDLTKPDTSAYSPNFDYELYVTLVGSGDIVQVDLDGTLYDCFNISFGAIKGTSVGYDNSFSTDYSNLSTDLFVLGI
jgi:hypothetical protein